MLIGTGDGLLSVPLSGAAPVPLIDGQSGSAAPPLVLAGCEYGAWSNGTAFRRCLGDGGDGSTLPLEGMTGAAALTFSVNTGHAVLNDTRSGATWAVQQNGELIDNWDDLIVEDQDQQQQQNDDDVPPQIDPEQKPPVAVDDQFGARPGKSTLLPVLLNDYDPAVFLMTSGNEVIGLTMLRQWLAGFTGPVAALGVIQMVITLIVLGAGRLFFGVKSHV